jgi:hypothetical protein
LLTCNFYRISCLSAFVNNFFYFFNSYLPPQQAFLRGGVL